MEGVFEQLGMKNFVIDIRQLNWSIKKKINYALENKNLIRLKLNKKMKEIKKLAMKPAYKVKEILEEKNEI